MRRCVAGLSAIPPIRLTAPNGINREQQVMQQNQKLGTQPNAKRGVRSLGSMPVPKKYCAIDGTFPQLRGRAWDSAVNGSALALRRCRRQPVLAAPEHRIADEERRDSASAPLNGANT
jgi:hypothetical protein